MKRELSGIGMTSQRTRKRMVERLEARGIQDPRVLALMARMPRHLFIEEALASRAYEDTALPIGFEQTISQPFVVAVMIAALRKGREGKLGRVLGPQGKMPSPKSGTVTPDIANAIKEYCAGKLEYRNDSGGNVHAVVGKISFEAGKLQENIQAFVDRILAMKPNSVKGNFVRSIAICATMSPSVRVAA